MAANGMVGSIKREAALTTTYSRGCDLVRAGKVRSIAYENDPDLPGVVDVTGKVRGSSLENYSVMVALDLDNEMVFDHVCDCPAHMKYGGMCKHAIALALAYLAQMGYPGVPQPGTASSAGSESRQALGRVKSRTGRRAKPKAFTSPQIERLISDYAARTARELEREMSAAQIEAEAEQAELQCVIATADAAWRYSSSKDTWALGLKISRGKASYVVKSVADLVRAWETGAMVSYGKHLEFSHRRSAFSPAANELLELLSGMVDAQKSLFAAQVSRGAASYWESSPTRVPQKTLPISTAQLLEVLRIIEGGKVVFEDYDLSRSYESRKMRRTLAVQQADTKLDVVLAPDDADGFEMTVQPSDLTSIYDGTSLALIGDNTIDLCTQEFSRALGGFCAAVLPMRVPLRILEQDMQSFCAAVLPSLRAHAHLLAPPGVDDYLPPTPEFSFRIRLDHGIIICKATVAYGDTMLSLFEDVREGQVVRDARREMAAQRVVATYFPFGVPWTPDYAHPLPKNYHVAGYILARSHSDMWDPDGSGHAVPTSPFFHEEDDGAYFLLFAEGLARLAEFGEVLLSERLRGVTVRSAPAVRVDASVQGGLLNLEVVSDDLEARELIAYLASYRRKQKYVKLQSGDIVRLDGAVEAVAELANGLGVEPEDLVGEPQEFAANRTLFVDAMLKRAEGVRFERNQAFRQIVRDFETVADADFTPPPGLRAVLRPYQTEGFKWLCTLGRAGFGGILADDMGLGKTLQLLAYLVHEKAVQSPEGRVSLVVCPASLVYNWRAEAQRFAPELRVACLVGTKPQRRSIMADAASYDLLVTSYDLLRRDVDELTTWEFACVALDEAQYVKNSETKVAKAVRRLKADVRFALTGTPIENRLLELWSIFDFLMPGVLGSAGSFSRRFANPISSGDEQAARSLRRLVGPFILRRSKRDVLRDLPDKSEAHVVAIMEGEQEKLYRASETKLALSLKNQLPQEFAGSRIKLLAELTKLRQICCDPHLLYENYAGGSAKLETCLELVRQAVEGGHQLLLFSQFTSMLDIIAERLDKERIGWFSLTGATSKEARVRLVECFQAGEAPVFLISLKAGGTGLNLTAADVVIHYDPWWNLAAQNQATDRTHRIGQTREVSVFKLITQGTIEERIVAMQEAKQDLANSVLGGEAAQSSSITREDILALLDAATE